ncbi:MAG: pyruvate kinase, partial [Halobacteriota archaeon]
APFYTDDEGASEALMAAGMAVARINTSHGTPEEHRAVLERVRRIDRERDGPVATMIDLQGPEIRTEALEQGLTLSEGDTLSLVEGRGSGGDELGVSIDPTRLERDQAILFDDGRVEAVVTAVGGDAARVRIESGGRLEGRVGVNVPGVDPGLDVVTEPDEVALDLAVDLEVDFVAASFVASGRDVLSVSEALEARGATIPVIAKIERQRAFETLDDIVEAADGVMIARGDLGVELPLENVPIIQKRIIRRCREAGVPTVTATEMLDSMIEHTRPTRAEVSDVANAVLDETDAVMLSGETAIGDQPVAVVETMNRILRAVEASEEHAEQRDRQVPPPDRTHTDSLARSARFLARDVEADAIVVATESGYTARRVAKFRPSVPIVAVTPTETTRRRLAIVRGVVPLVTTAGIDRTGDVIGTALDRALNAGAIQTGDTVIALSGLISDIERETTDTLQVRVAAERLGVGTGVVPGRASGVVATPGTGDLEHLPEGAILYLAESFDDELTGRLTRIAGIIHERPGMTGYPAMIAREVGIPMVSGASLPPAVRHGDIVSIDGSRGIIYRGDVVTRVLEGDRDEGGTRR